MSKRILCIHAHPDDAEILVAGTLALLAQKGHTVMILSMTAGDCGSSQYPPEVISSMRRQEAARAAAIIGASYHCGDFKDLSILVDDFSRRRVTGLLRQLTPDIVLTSSPVDYHCDHEATSSLVRTACFASSCRNYLTPEYAGAAPLPSIPHLYFADPISGLDPDGKKVIPDFVVDVSSAMETKKTMLAAHESQRAWLKQQHGLGHYVTAMEEWTRQIGGYAGLAYGEGFRLYRGHPYPATPLLEELLGESLIRRCDK